MTAECQNTGLLTTMIGKPLYIFKSDADRAGHSFH
jgi:hypothetical protein